MPTLEQQHLADLHALAAEHGVERFRMLPRAELIAALRERAPDLDGAESSSEEESGERGGDGGGGSRSQRGPRRGRGGRSRRSGRGRDSGGDRDSGRDRQSDDEGDSDEEDQTEEVASEPVSGVLDITPRGHGFIRLQGLEASDGDVYVSPSQIRRCEMERGDEVAGPARPARRGERYPALVHVDTINGTEPGTERLRLSDATPVKPSRRITLSPGDDATEQQQTLLRAFDLLTPLARGQRVVIEAAAGSGRTTLLKALAGAIAPADDLELVVLLIDERPEELAAWREAAPDAELAAATLDMRSGEQLRLVELALGRASRRAEAGADVVLLIDSLSRIAVAADDPGRLKPIFGAGRETEEKQAGSLTIVATTLLDDEDEGGVNRAIAAGESALLVLDRDLASAGVTPAIAIAASRIADEEQIRDEAELAGARALRAELADLSVAEAADVLGRRIASTDDNAALLNSLAE